MNIIETVAPISIEELKKYFTDKNNFYLIDYSKSKLKGKKLLTYLSNLEIPSDINFIGTTEEEFSEIFKEYLNLEMICNVPSLEKITIDILKEFKGLSNQNIFDGLIQDNTDILKEWVSKLDSLTLYNMYSIGDEEFKKFVESHTLDETNCLKGVNFVSLLKHKEFYSLYEKIEQRDLKFYKKYFEDYMFKGKNLYSYWANENNPMFLLTFGIAGGLVTGDDYVSIKKQTIQELKDVSPIQ
jgi:hypothetical protein